MVTRSRTGKGSKAAAKAKETTPEPPQETAEAQIPLWKKVFNREATLTPKEILSTAHWIRQVLAILLGIVYGVLQLKGLPFVMSFIITSLSTPPALLMLFHEIDQDEVAKIGHIQTEGFMPAGALFLLSWILSYTCFLPST